MLIELEREFRRGVCISKIGILSKRKIRQNPQVELIPRWHEASYKRILFLIPLCLLKDGFSRGCREIFFYTKSK